MKQFKEVLREVNWILTEIALFEGFVNSTLLFLGFYLLLSFFGVSFYYSLIPPFLYILFFMYIAIKKSKPAVVESKYTPLKEKLRTAADNVEHQSPVLEELEYEVTSEMKKVGLSLFINPKTLSYKIFAATILSFLVIFSSTMNIKFDSTVKRVPDIFEKKIKGTGNFIATKLETSDDIYGDKDVAKLGSNELNIKIRPVDFRVSVTEEGTFEKKEFETIFPQDVFVKESRAFEENIEQENQELVKSYFKKLATT